MAMAMEFEVLDHPKLCFGEGPRWHDGSLHVVDMYGDEAVYKVESEGMGEVTEVVKVPGQPSGTGWLPDGRMIVVSMKTRKVLAFDGRTLSTHADLGDLAAGEANDMVVDGTGRAYVGNFGFDLFSLGSLLQKVKYYAFLALFAITSRPFTSLVPGTADLVCLSPDGKARKVAAGLLFPNGMVITPDGGTLIVAETLGARLTAFDILEADGGLASRRVWAKLPWGATADGICLDSAGGVWVASPTTKECLRVEEGGRVTHRVRTSQPCFACALGGGDGRTLYACTAPSHHREECQRGGGRRGRIERARGAPHPRAGWP